MEVNKNVDMEVDREVHRDITTYRFVNRGCDKEFDMGLI